MGMWPVTGALHGPGGEISHHDHTVDVAHQWGCGLSLGHYVGLVEKYHIMITQWMWPINGPLCGPGKGGGRNITLSSSSGCGPSLGCYVGMGEEISHHDQAVVVVDHWATLRACLQKYHIMITQWL